MYVQTTEQCFSSSLVFCVLESAAKCIVSMNQYLLLRARLPAEEKRCTVPQLDHTRSPMARISVCISSDSSRSEEFCSALQARLPVSEQRAFVWAEITGF